MCDWYCNLLHMYANFKLNLIRLDKTHFYICILMFCDKTKITRLSIYIGSCFNGKILIPKKYQSWFVVLNNITYTTYLTVMWVINTRLISVHNFVKHYFQNFYENNSRKFDFCWSGYMHEISKKSVKLQLFLPNVKIIFHNFALKLE